MLAAEIMQDFARRTGLDPVVSPPRRYLWTDAFAVSNYLGLWEATSDVYWRTLARRLVDQVHWVLGRHRPDDRRVGWISGLSEDEGARHPTLAGLRIGKPRRERRVDEPLDPTAEWERDGQYYHYLTRWIHALQRMWQVAGDADCLLWAVELALGAHRAFVGRVGAARGLWWKVSVDASRPQVARQGQHDPLDGLLTLTVLADAAGAVDARLAGRLRPPLADLEEMCIGRRWATDDPLGAGGLLFDTHRCAMLALRPPTVAAIAPPVAREAATSLEAAAVRGAWRSSPRHRLAFRELGLSIGIRAADRVVARLDPPPPPPTRPRPTPYDGLLRSLDRYHSLADTIERFWLDPRTRATPTWQVHRDISSVMLATSLFAHGLLDG